MILWCCALITGDIILIVLKGKWNSYKNLCQVVGVDFLMLNRNYYTFFLVDHFIPFRVTGRGHIRAKAASTDGWVASSSEGPMWQFCGFCTLLKSTLAVLWRCSGSRGRWHTVAIISVKLLYLCGEHKWPRSFVLFKNGFICATNAYIIISLTERHQNKLEHYLAKKSDRNTMSLTPHHANMVILFNLTNKKFLKQYQ